MPRSTWTTSTWPDNSKLDKTEKDTPKQDLTEQGNTKLDVDKQRRPQIRTEVMKKKKTQEKIVIFEPLDQPAYRIMESCEEHGNG